MHGVNLLTFPTLWGLFAMDEPCPMCGGKLERELYGGGCVSCDYFWEVDILDSQPDEDEDDREE
jgi:hypothetical protein